MKFMRQKRFTFLVMLTLVVTVIAGCSGGAGTPAEVVNKSPAEENKQVAAEPAEEKQEPAIDLKGRAVRISNWWDAAPKGDSEADERARERIQNVEKKYNVKISYLNTDYGATSEKISSSVMANEPFAEIVRVPDGNIWGLMQGGFLTPLDDYLKDTKIQPDVIDSMRFGSDNVFGLTGWYTPNDSGMFYNKRLFKEAGLKDPQH